MRVFTVQLGNYRVVKANGIKLIDTTVKSGLEAFAPTWDMVKLSKDSAVDGITSVDAMAVYETQYRELMKQSMLDHPKDWFNIFHVGDIALACYCGSGKFCHRHILADILQDYAEDNYYRIENVGELLSPKIVPAGDGVDYLDIGNRAVTVLGRALSATSSYGFDHPKYGRFNTLEGYYWYIAYMLDGCSVAYGVLKELDGKASNAEGKASLSKLDSSDIFGSVEFRELFMEGVIYRLEQNRLLMDNFMENRLPLKAYYKYDTGNSSGYIDSSESYLIKNLNEYKRNIKSK